MRAAALALSLMLAPLALLLHGCGEKAQPQAAMTASQGASGHPEASEGYSCKSSLHYNTVTHPSQKGLDLDDTTMKECPTKIPVNWPHTDVPVSSLRLFKPWNPDWGDEGRKVFWDELVKWVKRNNAKVLLGTTVTCNEDDEGNWRWNKEIMKLLGPEHIMGLAVGNELELLQWKGPKFVTPGCMEDIWEKGRFFRKTVERVEEMDSLGPGFDKVPVTSVFGGYALSGDEAPFVNTPGAKVNDYLVNVTRHFGKRWAFTFNVYPYYNPANQLDPNTTDNECNIAIDTSVCYTPKCNVPATTFACRKKMRELTGAATGDYKMWLGETGWSWPKAGTLSFANPAMDTCPDFSSERVFRSSYDGFLKWDLSIGDLAPPDHMFWFTMRDSDNFAVAEHFGLIPNCSSALCKMQAGDPLGSAKYEVLVM